MKRYRKIVDNRVVIKPSNKIVVVKDGRQYVNPSQEMILADGWEEYSPMASTLTDEQMSQNAAEAARNVLVNSDYKIIKCMEAYLCGESLPYDIVSLHIERDKQRRIINDYEEE